MLCGACIYIVLLLVLSFSFLFSSPVAVADLVSDKATLHDDKNYKVTLKASEHKVLGKQLQVESMAGDRNGLGGSQKGEVVWLSDNYAIALHMSINQFAESFSALTPSEPIDVT